MQACTQTHIHTYMHTHKQKELIETERSVRERLKKEFEDLVTDLGTQLTMVKSQFKEYRESLQQDMKSNLHDIRKEALMKMVCMCMCTV